MTTYAATLAAIRNGSLSVFLPTSELGYVPITYLGAEVTAMLADAAPDAESKNWELGQSLGARTATAIGRALLMETSVTPRTGPEIPRQLQRTGYSIWQDVQHLASPRNTGKKAYDETSDGVERLYAYLWNLTSETTLFSDLLVSSHWGIG